jgi:hypothetical protein
MNINFKPFYAQCFGIDQENQTFDCVVHAARSRSNKIMTFHVHLDNGAHYSLLPLHKLKWKDVVTPLAPNELQTWDCFSDEVEAIAYDYFRCSRVYLIGQKLWGEYVLTFDWQDNVFSDYPPEFKQGHLIKLDNGQFGIYPNNYLLFEDKSYTGKLEVESVPRLQRQTAADYVTVEQFHTT